MTISNDPPASSSSQEIAAAKDHKREYRLSKKYAIVHRTASFAADRHVKFHGITSARIFLSGFVSDLSGMRAMREALQASGAALDISKMKHGEIIEQLAHYLAMGFLRIVDKTVVSYATAGDSGSARDGAGDAGDTEAAVVDTLVRHWIKLKIVDDATNEPVSGVVVKLKLPTGETQEIPTDGRGLIEVKDVPDNEWEILEINDPEILEVIEIQ